MDTLGWNQDISDFPGLLEARQRRRSAEHRYALPGDARVLKDKVRGGWGARIAAELSWESESGEGKPVSSCVAAALDALERLENGDANVQAFGDFWGMLLPGKPGMAAAWAWRSSQAADPSFAHAAMFFAGVVAPAYVAVDAQEAVYVGLGELPEDSPATRGVRLALEASAQGKPWDDAFRSLNEALEETALELGAAQLARSALALLRSRERERPWEALADVIPKHEPLHLPLRRAIAAAVGVHLGADRLTSAIDPSALSAADELAAKTLAVAKLSGA